MVNRTGRKSARGRLKRNWMELTRKRYESIWSKSRRGYRLGRMEQKDTSNLRRIEVKMYLLSILYFIWTTNFFLIM